MKISHPSNNFYMVDFNLFLQKFISKLSEKPAVKFEVMSCDFEKNALLDFRRFLFFKSQRTLGNYKNSLVTQECS